MLTDVLHMYVIHAHGLCLETSSSSPLAPFTAPPPRVERGVAFIHRSQGRRQLHKRGVWLKWAWLEEPYPNPALSPPDSGRLRGEPSARDEGDTEAAPP